MLTNNDTLKALYATELFTFLEKANLKDDYDQGKIKCCYCDCIIAENNLYALIPDEDHFDFCCTRAECILKLSQDAKK